MRDRRILAGTGYFTPERRNTTALGAVWITSLIVWMR